MRVRPLFFTAAMFGLCGCFSAPRFNPVGELQAPIQAQAICSKLCDLERGGRPFRALLNATLSAPDGESYSFRYAVVGADQGRLRVDLLPNEGAFTLGLITISDQQALLIDSQQKVFARGCNPESMFERFFGLEGINSEVIRALVTGGVPALNCEAVQVYHQGAGEITLLDTVRHYAWRVSEQSGEVLGVSILDESNSATLAVAQRTVKAQQRVIEITLYKPAQAEAQMFVARFNAKPNISSELFEVAVPSGYTQDSCD